MVLAPRDRAVVVRVAASFDTVPLPKRVEPSKNSTVPVGEAGPVDAGAMAAVNVTSCSRTGDAGEKKTVVDVVACAVFTVTAGEELAA
jgi:hypothetical protein